MSDKQHTIKQKVSVSGVGLHTGKKVTSHGSETWENAIVVFEDTRRSTIICCTPKMKDEGFFVGKRIDAYFEGEYWEDFKGTVIIKFD